MKSLRTIACFSFFLLLASCGSLSSFESPNKVRNMPSTLYLTNNKSFEGKLIVQMGNPFTSDVKLLAEGDAKPMQFPLSEVVGYRLGEDYYALKDRQGVLGTGRHLAFMKRLTPETSRIHLYEDSQQEPQSGKGSLSAQTRYNVEHYLELPAEHGPEVYPLGGAKFVPHFEEKLSRLVAGCPALSQKIATKQDGYFYAQVNFSKKHRADVLLRIIEEYNQCGRVRRK